MTRVMITLLCAVLLFVSGCETAKGVGKDMQKAGDWIEEKASK